MTTYLLINILIIAIPFLFSFEKNIRFYKKITPVSASIALTGFFLIVWDSIAVSRGDWSFNDLHVSEFRFFNLPVEEILFFITVPYSILFVYESLNFYLKDKIYSINKFYLILFAVVSVLSGILLNNKNYTSTVLILTGLLFFFSIFLVNKNFFTKILLLTLSVSFIPFLIVNYFLTAIPVLIYNPGAITGIRISTIPAEDFFYSFLMISGWLISYKLISKQLIAIDKVQSK